METFINVIGFSAGLLVAGSLLPQIWRAHKRQSTEDLSYFWQATVATGVTLQLIYLYHYGMWAVFFPLFSELVFIAYLASLKLYYEEHLFGLGLGGSGPDLNRKMAGLSGNDGYNVVGGAGAVDGGGRDSGVGPGAGGQEGGGDAAAAAGDTASSEGLEAAEKGSPADAGEPPSQDL